MAGGRSVGHDGKCFCMNVHNKPRELEMFFVAILMLVLFGGGVCLLFVCVVFLNFPPGDHDVNGAGSAIWFQSYFFMQLVSGWRCYVRVPRDVYVNYPGFWLFI